MIPLLTLTLLSLGSVQSFPTPSTDLTVDLVPVIVEAGPGTVSLISGKLNRVTFGQDRIRTYESICEVDNRASIMMLGNPVDTKQSRYRVRE